MQIKAAFLACALLSMTPALAHNFWLNSAQVDPQTKLLCCGQNDCHLIPVTNAHPTSAGYSLDDTGEVIPWPRVQPSPDGGIWACRWGGETKCFFAPVPGA